MAVLTFHWKAQLNAERMPSVHSEKAGPYNILTHRVRVKVVNRVRVGIVHSNEQLNPLLAATKRMGKFN